MINLNDMFIFEKVAELKGISAAARVLNMPKSKVSRRVSELEKQLGLRLIERNTRNVNLTEAGEIYYKHCMRIVEEAENAKHSIDNMQEKPRGSLRISASVTIGQHFLSPLIAEFLNLYPDIKLDLKLTNRRIDLISEGYDMVVRVGKLEDSTLISKRLLSSLGNLYASPKYLNQYGIPQNISDLANHRCLVMSESSTTQTWQLIGPKNQLQTIGISPFAYINDLSALKKITEDGSGITLLPNYLVNATKKHNKLTIVLPQWQSRKFSLYAIYPSRQGMPLKLRVWLDYLEQKLSGINID